MLRIFNAKKPKEAGQAMVEFALAIIVFIPILFFIMDFGWITFQRVIFEYGYMHSSWDISASDLDDYDPLEEVPSSKTYSGPKVAIPLREELISSTAGIIASNLNIVYANAELHNEDDETKYSVPSRTGDSVDAYSRTRYMVLTAKITYIIHPLTPIGNLIFDDPMEIEKDLSRTKVVGTQHRSE
jgi:hypothetical protein